MKRSFTNIITFVFLGFLLIGVIGIFQNIVHDLHTTFSGKAPVKHVLAYQKS